jgi:hypothetical protein
MPTPQLLPAAAVPAPDTDELTPEERLRVAARILATGIRRLLARARPLAPPGPTTPLPVDETASSAPGASGAPNPRT